MCAKIVPKNLTTEQKANRRDVCLDILDCLEREPGFFSHVITGDESWILEYDPDTKQQSREWHTSKLSPFQESKNEQIQNQIDAHLFFFFFDSQGIVHKEFVPPGQTINETYYREVLERLRERVTLVRPGIARTWMLHHNNAPCHTAVSINEILAGKSIPVVPQPPSLPDLSPCDLFSFTRLKNHLKRAQIWYFG